LGGVGPWGVGGIWSKGVGMACILVSTKSSMESKITLFPFLGHITWISLLLRGVEYVGLYISNLPYECVMWRFSIKSSLGMGYQPSGWFSGLRVTL
jgi:hypothetical protein